MKGFIVICFNKKKKYVKKVAFRGPRGIVAGTGAGTGRQILFPGEWGAEKQPGTSGNGLPGFPVASLPRTWKGNYPQGLGHQELPTSRNGKTSLCNCIWIRVVSPSQFAPTVLALKTWVGLWPWKKSGPKYGPEKKGFKKTGSLLFKKRKGRAASFLFG